MEELKKDVAEIKGILFKLLESQCRDLTVELKSPNEMMKDSLKEILKKD